MELDYGKLVKEALGAKNNAYVPYSNFKVGAALLTTDGRIFTGVNIENVSFGATCCAERTAIFRSVACGYRSFAAIAVASDSSDYIYPCGICRQVMAEFRIPEIVVSDNKGNYKKYLLDEILPNAFTEF